MRFKQIVDGAGCGALSLVIAVGLMTVALPTHVIAQTSAASQTEALKKRVEQLEAQIVDMQVVIGTLESLARSGGGAPAVAGPAPYAGAGGSANGDARLSGVETQIRALTAQIEQLSRQVNGGGPGQRSSVPHAGGFGSTTVTAGPGAGAPNAGPESSGWSVDGTAVAAAPLGPAGGGDPKQDYETAYGYLLQQDYGAAEAAFADFLTRYPGDKLAGNAQYWLGESYYVRGRYKDAAGAFLKGYQNHAQSSKAPDSLLKLAMSLHRMGQKQAACSSYAELNQRFPKAPKHVKARASSERRRVGC